MSAVPTTITIEPIPASIARAYEELAVGLGRVADGLRQGDVRSLLPSPSISLDPVVIDLPGDAIRLPGGAIRLPGGAIRLPGGAGERPGEGGARLGDNRLAAMAIELTKTAAVVLMLYQGALTFLPAPARPRFVPVPAQASPASQAVLPSVTPTAPIAVDGQQTEVEVDGDGSSQPTAVP